VQANNLQGNEQLSREKLPESVLSSAGQFNKASTQGKNVEIVSNIDQLEKLPQLSSAGKEMLASEMSLNPNYIFVIPNEIPDKGFVAYYRVNTKTAETLGYSEFGTGLTMAEYDAIFAWYTVRLIGSTLGLMNCLVGEEVSLKSLGCSLCVMVTGVVGILTVGVTLTAAGVFASAAPLTFCQVGSLSAK
jgi:hypothetical protein